MTASALQIPLAKGAALQGSQTGLKSFDALAAAAGVKNVEIAQPEYYAYPAAVPNDPLYANHWGHDNTAQMISYD